MKNYKLIAFILGVILVIVTSFVLGVGPFKKPSSTGTQDKKLQVITTLYPLYDFVKNIGQDNVEVTLLLPPGIEPHAFEPKPNDVIRINQADVFVYTGKFMEVWAEDVLKGVTNKNLKAVDASEGIKLILSEFHDEDEPVGSSDPHIWLDFGNAQIMVDSITRGLAEKDPDNKDVYLARAASYKKSFEKLDEKYKTTLMACRINEVVYGGHYAFGYLAKRYGLNYVAAQGIAPDSEPTANDMVSLVKQIKTDGIKYVFYEELTSPKISQTLSKETGAQMLLLNAAHNVTKQDMDSGVSFLSIMEENLTNLKTGLECE